MFVVFGFAFALRLYHIHEPLLDFHPDRQYHSLILARHFYWKTQANIPDQEKKVAEQNANEEYIFEPRIREWIVAFGYKLVGAEKFWLPRLLSTAMWLLGAVFLFQIARRFGTLSGGILSLVFYLFIPFGITVSRAFMPDAWMIALILGSLYFAVKYFDSTNRKFFGYSVLFAIVAVLIKPFSILYVIPAFIGGSLQTNGIKNKKFLTDSLLFAICVSIISLPYYFYGFLFSRDLQPYATNHVAPWLLLTPFYWGGWLDLIDSTTGYIFFILGLIGFLFAAGTIRFMIAGLGVGYLLYCFTFSYGAHTHDYYHLMLIAIIALSISSFGMLLSELYRSISNHGLTFFGLLIVATISAAICIHQTRGRWKSVERVTRSEVAIAEEIGRQVNHSSKVIMLTEFYGGPLKYHANIGGARWPYTYDFFALQKLGIKHESTSELMSRIVSAKSPDYFVVADRVEFDRQHDLKEHLQNNYQILKETKNFIIFDLRHK